MAIACLVIKVMSLIATPLLFVCSGFYFHSIQPTKSDFLVSKVENSTTSFADAKVKNLSDSDISFDCKLSKYEHIDDECKIFPISPENSFKTADVKKFNASNSAATEKDIKEKNFFKIRLNTHKLASFNFGYKTIIEVFKKNTKTNNFPFAEFKIVALSQNNVFQAWVNAFLVKVQGKIPPKIGANNKKNKFTCKVRGQTEYSNCRLDIVDSNLIQNFKNIDVKQAKEIPNVGKIVKINKDSLYVVRVSEKYLSNNLDKIGTICLKITVDEGGEKEAIYELELKIENPVALKFKKPVFNNLERSETLKKDKTSNIINKDSTIKSIFLLQ